jgi:sulfoxide reductase heme-binding subunit YedZ
MESAIVIARATGWVALSLLGLALSMTPLGRVLGRVPRAAPIVPGIPRLRRLLGIASAIAASFHAAVALSGYLDGAWAAVVTWPHLRAGLVALLVLLALLLTSFPPVVRALRVKLWKPLHRLAYAAAALAALHVLLSPFAPRVVALAFFGALLAVGLFRFVPAKRVR